MVHDLMALHGLEDFDLVERLWIATRHGNPQLLKAKAHVRQLSGLPDLELYHAMGNHLADQTAVSTCKFLQPEVVKLSEDMFADLQQDSHHLKRLYQVFLQLRLHFAQLQQHDMERQRHPELRTEQCPSPADILSGWEVQSPWRPPDYGVRLLGFCAWGSDFATAVVAWMSQVSWPDTATVHAEDPGISWIELVLSFTLTAGMALPLRRERPDGTGYLQAFSDWNIVAFYDVTPLEVGHAFSNLILQVRKLHSRDL
jgi:hypothetical protein